MKPATLFYILLTCLAFPVAWAIRATVQRDAARIERDSYFRRVVDLEVCIGKVCSDIGYARFNRIVNGENNNSPGEGREE